MSLAKIRTVIPVVVLFANCACAAAQPTTISNAQSAGPLAGSCSAPGRDVASLKASKGSPNAVQSAIVWSDAVPREDRKLVEFFNLEGGCATSVNSFATGLASLRTGEAFAIDENQVITPRGRASAFLVPPEISTGALPNLPNAKFITASRVSYRRDESVLLSDYVGLWQAAGRWTVAAFSELKSGSYGPVKPLLTSERPLLGVTYFPAPDTQSGRLGLVQQAAPTTVRLVGYDWYHQSFFPVK